MVSNVRLLLLVEAAVFIIAAFTHFGQFLGGYEHQRAGIAETTIAAVLLLGWLVSWLRPGMTRAVGLVAQGFALLGTIVGVTMVAIGVGPRTPLDIIYHVGMIILLVYGLIVTVRWETHARVGT